MLASEPGHNPTTPRTGALLLFNEALPSLKAQRTTSLKHDVDRFFCLRWETTAAGGYATIVSAQEQCRQAAELLGAPVEEWPEEMTSDTHREVCRDVADRAWRMLQTAPDELSNHPVLRMKINDRVFNRMEPMARIERLLKDGIRNHGLTCIVAPWVGDGYETVERPGMMGINTPGHRVAAVLQRLQQDHHIEVKQLWPEMARKEKTKLFVARTFMAGIRYASLASRTIRDAIRPRPAGACPINRDLPTVGFIIGGASPWYHTKPLVDACRGRFQPVIIAHDIFRNPTTYRLLKGAGVPFVPIDSQLPVGHTLAALGRGAIRTKRLRKRLDRWRASNTGNWETAAELKADLACLTELELYVDQVRAAIRNHGLKAIVSSNVLDSLLSAGGEACRLEGVPMVCLQNTTAAFIHQPFYADCDLYFAESQAMADFMTDCGARGSVEAVGLPIYDELIRESRKGRSDSGGVIRQEFPELAHKRILSLIAAPKNHDYGPLLKPLLEMVHRRNDVGLIIRLHPRSEPTQYEQLGRELKSLGKGGRMHHTPLASFLADTDYMVATVSSTTQTALVMGVRPFCWVPAEWRNYADEAVQMHPDIRNRWSDPQVLIAALENALDDPQDDVQWRGIWMDFVARFMTGTDGMACERILDRISQVAA